MKVKLGLLALNLKLRFTKPENILIVHDDVDGISCASIALRALKGKTVVVWSGPREIHETLSAIRVRGKLLCIMDIGVNNDLIGVISSNLDRIRELGWRIYWIDHHSWSKEAIDEISKRVSKFVVESSPSAARLVFKVFGGDEVSKRIVEIGDDADTATYSMWLSIAYRALSSIERYRGKLVKMLASGVFTSGELEREAKRLVDREEKAIKREAERARILKTRSGRRFAVIDLRGRWGPGSRIAKFLAEEKGVDFSLVIYSCDSFGLYAGRDRSVNLKVICDSRRGGGHPFACGGRIDMPFYKGVFCRILRGRFTPSEIKSLINDVAETL